MEGLLAWQKEKPCAVGGGGAVSQGAMLPVGKIGRGCQIKLPFAAGIEQIGDSFILADGKNRRGFLTVQPSWEKLRQKILPCS